MLTENQNLSLNHKPGHVKHDGHNMTGFIIFLCSESIIFFAFFVGYSVLKISAPVWYPAGINGIDIKIDNQTLDISEKIQYKTIEANPIENKGAQ